MKALLLEIKAAVGKARDGGRKALGASRKKEFLEKYDEIIAEAQQLYGTLRRKRGRTKKPKEMESVIRAAGRKLACRMSERREEILLFMQDFTVPFDRYERRRSRAHSPGPTEPHSFGFGGLLRLAGWRTASAHHARQLVPACRRSSRALVELGSALACDH